MSTKEDRECLLQSRCEQGVKSFLYKFWHKTKMLQMPVTFRWRRVTQDGIGTETTETTQPRLGTDSLKYRTGSEKRERGTTLTMHILDGVLSLPLPTHL